MRDHNKTQKMADSSDSQSSLITESEIELARRELSELKRDLEGWREVLVPLRGLLTWQRAYYPIVLAAVTTLIFALIWFLEPSVLTTLSVMGLTLTAVDFAVPLVGPYLFARTQWTGAEERQFEEVCERVLHFRSHVSDFFQALLILKAERSKIYFVLVMTVLIFWAWMGYILNNLFLTYVIVLTVVLIPGLRQKGLIQRYLLRHWLLFKRVVFGRMDVLEKKSQ